MAGDTVGLADIVARLPALVLDAPVVARGTLTAFLVRGSAKKSIGRVFQDQLGEVLQHRQLGQAAYRGRDDDARGPRFLHR